jgi:thiamine thiazole synthase
MIEHTAISSAIVDGYHRKLRDHLTSDVLVVGAGPSGLVAAMALARAARHVTIVDKRLAPGGGIWGGAMAMNELIIQDQALPLVRKLDMRAEDVGSGLHRVDAVELASGLVFRAIQAGATLFNLTKVEDVCVSGDRVVGVVINRTGTSTRLPIDPLTMRAAAVIDATGHEASVVTMLRRRGLGDLQGKTGEGPMDAAEGERFVVARTGWVHAGLWLCGMAVNAVFGGPRMGPIFGGMLLSGERCAQQIDRALNESAEART